MTRKAHFAIGFAPDGQVMWFTAACRVGGDSEDKARMMARELVCRELVSPSVRTLPYGLWEHIAASGYSVKTFEVEVGGSDDG